MNNVLIPDWRRTGHPAHPAVAAHAPLPYGWCTNKERQTDSRHWVLATDVSTSKFQSVPCQQALHTDHSTFSRLQWLVGLRRRNICLSYLNFSASNMECVRSRCNKQRQYEKRLTLEYGVLLAHMASLLLVESRRRVGLQKRRRRCAEPWQSAAADWQKWRPQIVENYLADLLPAYLHLWYSHICAEKGR